jgi:hypothetical protein
MCEIPLQRDSQQGFIREFGLSLPLAESSETFQPYVPQKKFVVFDSLGIDSAPVIVSMLISYFSYRILNIIAIS